MKNKLFAAFCLLILLSTLPPAAFAQKEISPNLKLTIPKNLQLRPLYDSVPNDPMKTRIYTLGNGLKVYMTVNRTQPKAQCYIAVRAGSKNDPSYATGLAHYLEHMVFKGTDKFGTLDFEKEKPLIDKIEQLYETYRVTTDAEKRKQIYHQIDSISGVAAKYAIANEYDKMMALIGAQKSNAYTSVDQTVYFEEVPANQLENWLSIQSERFRNPILRLFHTELEAVYEEKNMSLDSDMDKAFEALLGGLFQKHTYGTQTTIGTVEHLKNPSLTEINKYYRTHYLPNNMALCISGDIDPDKLILQINETMGKLKKGTLPTFSFEPEVPIMQPIEKTIIGPESEAVLVGYRFNGAATEDANYLTLLNEILSNGVAGLFDLNINQAQKALGAGSMTFINKDYSAHILMASNKQGQELSEVVKLLNNELNKIKSGNIDDALIYAAKLNLRLKFEKMLESNDQRASAYVDAFTKGVEWKNMVNSSAFIQSITKQQLIAFCKKNYNNNYVVVYKRTGEGNNVQKVIKPEITPVEVNREQKSPFYLSVEQKQVQDIKPSFLNFSQELVFFPTAAKQQVVYKQNNENSLFTLFVDYNFGSVNDPMLDFALRYFELAGASNRSAEDLKKEFYKIGCNATYALNENGLKFVINGISDQGEKAIELFNYWLSNPAINKEVLTALKEDYLKERADNQQNKDYILRDAMMHYALYGKDYAAKSLLSADQIKALTEQDLVNYLKKLANTQKSFLYYGSAPSGDVLKWINNSLAKNDNIPPTFNNNLAVNLSTKPVVYFFDYKMTQAEIMWLSDMGKFSPENYPIERIYNEYFGGGMAAIVFQTLRESKALAYSAKSKILFPTVKGSPVINQAFIGTQSDKLPEAMEGMVELLRNMPAVANTFNVSKNGYKQNLITNRLQGEQILIEYDKWSELGYSENFAKATFDKTSVVTLEELVNFQKNTIKPLVYTIILIGDKDKIDFSTLAKYGEVITVTGSTIFAR